MKNQISTTPILFEDPNVSLSEIDLLKINLLDKNINKDVSELKINPLSKKCLKVILYDRVVLYGIKNTFCSLFIC